MATPKIRRRRTSIDDIRAQLDAFEAAHPGAHAGNFPDVFRDERRELVPADAFVEGQQVSVDLSGGRFAGAPDLPRFAPPPPGERMTQQGFDGLAVDYDRFRPRYPAVLLDGIVAGVPDIAASHVIDTGAGTGIVLEGLVPRLPPGAQVEAVDVSADMVARGREKFPSVVWHSGPAEPFLERSAEVDLVLAAQAYQWMDCPRYLRAAAECLSPGGRVVVLQNNRDHTVNAFLDAYESLLEELSPGYSRSYRAFDVAAELSNRFGKVGVERTTWEQRMAPADFVGMSGSSTQVARVRAAHGEEFVRRRQELVEAFASGGERVISYTSEAFTGASPVGSGG